MEKGELLVVIVVALIVAVISSFITASITGNVINVAKGTAGKVYTTDETDKKFDSLDKRISNQTRQINNLTIMLNNTNNILNNTIGVLIFLSNQTGRNNTIIGNWSIPGNVTVVTNRTATALKK